MYVSLRKLCLSQVWMPVTQKKDFKNILSNSLVVQFRGKIGIHLGHVFGYQDVCRDDYVRKMNADILIEKQMRESTIVVFVFSSRRSLTLPSPWQMHKSCVGLKMWLTSVLWLHRPSNNNEHQEFRESCGSLGVAPLWSCCCSYARVWVVQRWQKVKLPSNVFDCHLPHQFHTRTELCVPSKCLEKKKKSADFQVVKW